jgi:hypothetical protein
MQLLTKRFWRVSCVLAHAAKKVCAVRVARRTGLFAIVLATVLLAVAPASGAPLADGWKYAFHVRGPGNAIAGDTHGWLTYTEPDDKGCSQISTQGTLRDLNADGQSIILYVRARSCSTGKFREAEAGYVAGEGKESQYFWPSEDGFTKGLYKEATVELCTYKDGRDGGCSSP